MLIIKIEFGVNLNKLKKLFGLYYSYNYNENKNCKPHILSIF